MIELKILACLIAQNFEIRVVHDPLDAEARPKGKPEKDQGCEGGKVSRATICLVG